MSRAELRAKIQNQEPIKVTFQCKMGNQNEDFQEAGDIINFFLAPVDMANVQPGQKFYYLCIPDFPGADEAKARGLQSLFTEHDWVGSGKFDENGEEIMELRNSRRWSIPPGSVSQAARDQVRTNGYIERTWAEARPHIMEKLARIPRDDDPDNSAYDPALHSPVTDEQLANA